MRQLRSRSVIAVAVLVALSTACGAPEPSVAVGSAAAPERSSEEVHAATVTASTRLDAKGPGPGEGDYFPLRRARAVDHRIDNREAPIPIQCYTKTEGRSNPCWTCHTESSYPNLRNDAELQADYSFSEYGETNRWANAFVDRREAIAAIDDARALAWVRQDNYAQARAVLAGQLPPWAYGWDLDLPGGFDDEGFARDGSGWRAFRYKPFPGAFWPTNGSTDDVMIRLAERFRTAEGTPSAMVYKANLALLEASMASDPTLPDAEVVWPVEPLDERALGTDLDGDGVLEPAVEHVVGLPGHYLGDAADHPLHRGTYPEGTELLHSVRYLDPEAPSMISARLKELRYLHKEQEVPRRRYFSKYEQEANDKEEGLLPRYQGNAETGLLSTFGWRVQGYIEDERGRLRLQTREEHYACMGCHSGIGVTADSTFSFARKVPGSRGWGYQSLEGLPDVPQLGHAQPEVLTYFQRVGGGDELRANDEILARFFAGGQLDEAEVLRAAPGGDRRLVDLVMPSRERALQLDKAYMVLVAEQSFERGREPMLAPPVNVHERVQASSTGLAEAGRVYRDGTVRLQWPASWRSGAR